MSYVFVPNSMSVVHFVLVDFGEVVLVVLVLVVVTGVKQSQLLVPSFRVMC